MATKNLFKFVRNIHHLHCLTTARAFGNDLLSLNFNTATKLICSRQNHWKTTQYQGVKGIRKKNVRENEQKGESDVEKDENARLEDNLNLDDREYDDVAAGAMNLSRNFDKTQNVLIIQPYVKWGPKRNVQITPDDQLKEAEALVRSLPNWKIALSLKVPLESLDRKVLFGTGKLQELKSLVAQLKQSSGNNQQPLTCVFVSKGTLTFMQKQILGNELRVPVMDRYSVVIQILRLHATSAEARIQVAMAEIPYIWALARDTNLSMSRKQGYSLSDTQREILKTRERKLRLELERIRSHRKLLRNKRKQKNYPTVAVVGYTNAGKTSLIKALTDEQTMQPRDQLFATLDVTAHAGVLPCNLEVIFMDTVGFMSDLPTGLIECFVATLEDAMLADVIVHVQDISHDCYDAQRNHVETTLASLAQNITTQEEMHKLPPIINVGNKADLVPPASSKLNDLKSRSEMQLVSSTERTGLQQLLEDIEKSLLISTGRKLIQLRIPNGGAELAWLYKNAAIVDTKEDKTNAEYLLMDVIITEGALGQFNKNFL